MRTPPPDHDGGYKLLFSQPRMVADLIRGFVREPWVEKLDFSSLERVSPAYVSDELKHRAGDVGWRLRVAREDWLYVYLVLEFQSRVDRFMPVRMLTYVGLLYQDLLRRGELGASGKLPPVLPLVLYNGSRRWRGPRMLSSLIERPVSSLSRYQPEIRLALVDVLGLTEQELPGTQNLAGALARLERVREPGQVEGIVNELVRRLPARENGPLQRALAAWLTRVLLPAKFGASAAPDVSDLEEVRAMLRETVVGWTKQWKEQGLREGRREGLLTGERRLLARQLRARFGTLPEPVVERLDQADSRHLLTWGRRLLFAATLDEVFKARRG